MCSPSSHKTQISFHFVHEGSPDDLMVKYKYMDDFLDQYPDVLQEGKYMKEGGYTRKMIKFLDWYNESYRREELTQYMMYREIDLDELKQNGCCRANSAGHITLERIDGLMKPLMENVGTSQFKKLGARARCVLGSLLQLNTSLPFFCYFH